jgi:tetratricopeptide (TPR) repeat protein
MNNEPSNCRASASLAGYSLGRRCACPTIFALICVIASTAFAQFEKASQEFANGQFTEAITDYESLAQKGEYSANLFYDLGNAYFRTHDLARAILNYERALAIDRHHAEALANLHLTRDAARALEMPPTQSEKMLRAATANQWSICAAVFAWGFLFLIVWRRSRAVIALSILSLSIFAGASYAAYKTNAADAAKAIVIAKDVTARVATADNANRVLALPAGSEIEVVSKRGDWIYATLPNNQRGWIPATAAESVRL